MKKIIGFFVALSLALILTACGKKHPVEMKDEKIGRSTYNCYITVGNTDNITKGSVFVKVNEINKNGSELYTTKTLTGYEGSISVTGLKSETDYRNDLYVTIDKKQELIYTWNFKTTKSGTEADPYVITTAAQLVEAISADYSQDAYYKLGNDIDFNEYVEDETNEKIKFSGLCTSSSQAFSGNLDGNGKTIKNVTITADQAYTGFFGYVKGTIRDINFENITVDVKRTSSTTTYVGAVCGYAYGAKLNNVNINGAKINVDTQSQYVGGLAGYAFATNILFSDVKNLVLNSKGGTTVYAGGATAYICQNSKAKYGIIDYVTVDGKINVDKASTLYYGGAVGYVKAGAKVSQTVAKVDAVLYSSSNVFAGGLIGNANFGNGEDTDTKGIKNVASYGSIKYTSGAIDNKDYNKGNVLVGGLIGSATATDIDGAYVNVNLNVEAKMYKNTGLYVGSVFGRGYEFHTALNNGIVNAAIVSDTAGSYSASEVTREDVAKDIKKEDVEKEIDKDAIRATVDRDEFATDEDYEAKVEEEIAKAIDEAYEAKVDEAYDKEVANATKNSPALNVYNLDGSSYLDGLDYLPLSNTNPLIVKLDVNGAIASDTVAVSEATAKQAGWDLNIFDVKVVDGNFEISFKY